jgi:hypothetical protein
MDKLKVQVKESNVFISLEELKVGYWSILALKLTIITKFKEYNIEKINIPSIATSLTELILTDCLLNVTLNSHFDIKNYSETK